MRRSDRAFRRRRSLRRHPGIRVAFIAALILVIERRITAVYGDLVEAAEDPKIRALGIEKLLAAAAAQITWGGAPVAFPGDV